VLTSERPFQVVLDGIYAGISQPDTGALFAKLAAKLPPMRSFTALVRQAQGSAGLFRFWHLDDDHVPGPGPAGPPGGGGRLVRLIAGNPVTMGQMDPGTCPRPASYAPVTILIPWNCRAAGKTQGGLRHRRQRRSRPTPMPPPPRSPSGWTPKCSGLPAPRDRQAGQPHPPEPRAQARQPVRTPRRPVDHPNPGLVTNRSS